MSNISHAAPLPPDIGGEGGTAAESNLPPGEENSAALDDAQKTHAEAAGFYQANAGGALGHAIAQSWLDWQCRMVAGIIRGTLFIASKNTSTEAAQLTAAANWPKTSSDELALEQFATQAASARANNIKARHRYGPGQQRVCDVLACPLIVDDEVIAVVACGISTRSEAQQQAILQLLQWGSLWLDSLVKQQSQSNRGNGTFLNNLLSSALSLEHSQAACVEVATRLAQHFDCERVSIGLRENLHSRLYAISHLAGFDGRSEMARQIEAAMDEASNQHSWIVLPQPAAGQQTDSQMVNSAAHKKLAATQNHPSVITLPLTAGTREKPEIVGAITLERSGELGFAKAELEQLQLLARVIGPCIDLKRKAELSTRYQLKQSVNQKLRALFGPEKTMLKVSSLCIAAVVMLLAFVEGNYSITAPAQVEAASRQALVAPVDGYIESVELRAGDLVNQGQQIASLKEDTLKLEKQKWENEYLKVEKEYQQALGERDRKKLSVLRAKLDQLKAERMLVENKLARTKIVAPFDGMIVSGDLSRQLGAPVKRGDVLFEVAPVDNYRVTLEIDEFDMDGVRPGKQGKLVVAALPGQALNVTLEQLIPVAVAEDGRNYFRLEAALAEEADFLRPGMRGVAKIDMGERKLLWIWTHSLIDRLRMWAWSVGL
ncbi:MAG: HlyD family efflux transporter periplasmic adaptor subunit [Pseudomonadales bacterium]|nr:HlyD family efflux transporter periplasmic adaptor subunit [Pseudomonadales bacterium]